ncbi:molybdopterin-dependent oxidoreductase [Streptomyces hoynatensis]|uniref:Molybdopterin-binding protein n=1 Tax=Streptomyces hoynatensis TaxID=1141874 RepID=A0A3A9Z3E9_9ACTN|nr:molybdopterin-dependent oxidoreductase [Streptomyces hoynatensis]RKN42354.1 molybdopterin-binding protein [Streptomyces hoynatensis]
MNGNANGNPGGEANAHGEASGERAPAEREPAAGSISAASRPARPEGAAPALVRRAPVPPLPRFRGPLHDARTATAVGRWLGLAMAVCFLTGLVSHELQSPQGWLAPHLPSRPVSGYRLTQGLHVASGIAAIPLLLVKLWTVYPRLFAWPPARSVRHALERLSIGALVGSALLELFLGLVNIAQWYPWPFPFVPVHWALAWVLIGSLLLHVAVKAPDIARHWRRDRTGADAQAAERRSLLRGVGAAVGTLTLVTAGQSFGPLRPLTLLAPRRPDGRAQGVPVNRTAAEAGVLDVAAESWRLHVAGPRPFELSLAELRALPQYTARLPIACVEGWSVSAEWTGVRLRDLVERAGAPAASFLRVVSLQRHGGYRVMEMGPHYASDPATLLALRLNGAELSPDHGYPARIIAPNRPGVWQTKWVARIEVLR